jgi:hypothetical protein
MPSFIFMPLYNIIYMKTDVSNEFPCDRRNPSMDSDGYKSKVNLDFGLIMMSPLTNVSVSNWVIKK